MAEQTITAAPPAEAQTGPPDMSIVLVGWNNKDYLEPCLDSPYQAGLR